jgi:hypothetical protein
MECLYSLPPIFARATVRLPLPGLVRRFELANFDQSRSWVGKTPPLRSIIFPLGRRLAGPLAACGILALLLDAVGGHRTDSDASRPPAWRHLEALKGAVSKKLEQHLEPLNEAAVGSFRVRAFSGRTPEHHMAHLFQMGSTVLPELVARWEP